MRLGSPSVFPVVSLSSFRRFLRGSASRLALVLLVLSVGVLPGYNQTAHFSGAQVSVAGGGTGILAIATDPKGNVFFTAQGAFLATSLQQSATSTQQSAYQGPGSMLFACSDGCETVTVLDSGLTAPTGLAFDATGNLYVLDRANGTLSEILAVNGSIPLTSQLTINTVVTNIPTPNDLAIDGNGDLYLTAGGSNSVEEVLAVNGTIPPSPTIRTLASGFNFPTGIAVDKQGNVYVGDSLNNAVKEILAVNGVIPASPAIVTLGNGFSLPVGVAVDQSGNVYVSDQGNNELKEMLAVNGSIPASPAIESLGDFATTDAVALDGKGNLYVGAGNTSGSVFQVSLNSANFGSANLGATTSAIPLAFTFDTPGTLGSISVLTQGSAGLDFTDSGSDTCTPGTTYSAGQTCFIRATFAPEFAGTRIGAAVLKDVSGNPIATGYLNGTGVAPQVSFAPGTETTIPGSNYNGNTPTAVAFDGAGNLYVGNYSGIMKGTLSSGGYSFSPVTSTIMVQYGLAVDGAGNIFVSDDTGDRLVKETPIASGYVESTITSGFGPMGIAADGSGNIYVVDQAGGRILKETPLNNSYVESVAISGLSDPYGVAVDHVGNLYIVDPGVNAIIKETLSPTGFVQSTIPVSGPGSLVSIAIDGVGNLYVVDAKSIVKETLTSSGYVESTVLGDLAGPFLMINVDQEGNLFVPFTAKYAVVVKVDFSDPPALNFAATQPTTTSADSPQIVTLMNNGNAPLTFPVPASGNNPSIASNFTLDSSAPAACPLVSIGSTAAGILQPATSCELPISFTPATSGSVSGSLILTDNNLNTAAPAYAVQTVALSGTGVQATPQITWSAPAAISYGTALSASQLNASANVPGTFAYTPPVGTVLNAGTQILAVTFTPNDSTAYTPATASVPLAVNPAAQAISFAPPASIPYSASPVPLIATSTSGLPVTLALVSGPATLSGNVLTITGLGTISLTATQPGNANYQAATPVNASIVVAKGTPSITWPTPAPILYGTALSSTQLDASSTVAGTFVYTPAAGKVLAAGTHTLSVTFTPSNLTDYAKITATVQLVVQQVTTTITWATPAAIKYGKALSSTQLNAKASVSGTYTYTPPAGTALNVGTYTLSVNFTPTNTTDYTAASAAVQLTVNRATQTISFPRPSSPVSHTSPPILLSATATSGLPVAFAVQSGPATVSGDSLILTGGTGTVVIVASQSGNSNYLAATPVSRSITVN